MRARSTAWIHGRSGSGQWQQQQQSQEQEQEQHNIKHKRHQWNDSGYRQQQGRCQQTPQQFSELGQQVRHVQRYVPAQHQQLSQQQQQQPPPPQRHPHQSRHHRQRNQQELPQHQQAVYLPPKHQQQHLHLPPQPRSQQPQQQQQQQQQQHQRQHYHHTQRTQQQPYLHREGPALCNPRQQEQTLQYQTTHARQASGCGAILRGGAGSMTRRRRDSSSPVGRPSKRARSESLQQQQQQQAHQPLANNKQGRHWLDVLQNEALLFAKQAVPSEEEQHVRQDAFNRLQQVVTAALGVRPSQVMLFGSGRAGLALHSSDLDVLITGLCRPTGDNGGYEQFDKRVVTGHLRRIEARAYRSIPVNSSKLIAHARIPVLKLELRSGLELDVSLNDDASIQAANYLQRWQQDYAVLKPLVLVLKSILKHNGLSDVATGGLGSWSLANMALGHLMAEEKRGGVTDHVGHVLLTFLQRFGVDWSIDRDAVAVAQGGIVPRASLASTFGPFGGPSKLAVKDPLTGREVAGGSHRYADVAQLWRQLYTTLSSRGQAAAVAAAASGACSSSYSVLPILLDCSAVLQRRSVGFVVEQDRGEPGCRRHR